MTTRVRKQVYIDPAQESLLKRLAQSTGTTEAEIIRQAIDRQVRALWPSKPNLAAWEDERAFIAGLIRLGPLPGGRTWRREDLHGR